ncbi:MAG: ATP-dependent chaperone ClpB, partial [Candidatus Promineifilaceae bacterium]
NLGSAYIAALPEDQPAAAARDQVMAEVRSAFRPEFLNRLDEIILFHQLTPEQLADILDLMLANEIKLAAQQGIELAVSPAAKEWLLAQNDQPEYGARPLRRIIARNLREPLADYLLRHGRPEQARIQVDAGQEGLQLRQQPAGEPSRASE